MYAIVGPDVRHCRSTYDIREKKIRCVTYDIVGCRYDVVTYDIQEYSRYNVIYDIVGVTYDVVVTDLQYRR